MTRSLDIILSAQVVEKDPGCLNLQTPLTVCAHLFIHLSLA
jgi:hypothetical protein